MLIGFLLILALALLVGLRAFALIGRDSGVHCAGPKIQQGIRNQEKLERRLGLDKSPVRTVRERESGRELYGIYMGNRSTLIITRRPVRLPQAKDLTHA